MVMIPAGNGEVYTAVFRLKETFNLEIDTAKVMLDSLEKLDTVADPIVAEFAR
jgi:hypothetical protein